MENEVLNPAGEVKVKLEYRIDRLEKIVKCMGNTEEIEKLLNRIESLLSIEDSLKKRVKYYHEEATGAVREAREIRDALDKMKRECDEVRKERDEYKRNLAAVYDRICGALTFYESEDETSDPDCDKGLALYGDIMEIHGMMAEWGL